MTLKPSVGGGSALEWTKSSYSTNDGPECVEIATTAGAVHIRDSKNPQGPKLGFMSDTWVDFMSYISETRPMN
jgi:hypothetical protein